MKTRKPNRLKGFDYTQDNLYFVTSCVHKMVCCFGDVVGAGRDLPYTDLSGNDQPGNGDNIITEPRMMLNESGKIADRNGIGWGNNFHILFCMNLS